MKSEGERARDLRLDQAVVAAVAVVEVVAVAVAIGEGHQEAEMSVGWEMQDELEDSLSFQQLVVGDPGKARMIYLLARSFLHMFSGSRFASLLLFPGPTS